MKIKIYLEAILEVPNHVELGEDFNGIPYYLTMNQLEMHPALAFDDKGILTAPEDFNCKVLLSHTSVEVENA